MASSSNSIHNKTCPICLDHVEHHKAAILPLCFHSFCFPCILKWSQLKPNCPLCNSPFSSCFLKTSLSTFKGQPLPHPRLQRRRLSRPREFRRALSSAHTVKNGQSRPLPWRRSFGRSRFGPYDERQRHEGDVGERVLRWRASIYSRRLEAIPLPTSSKGLEQSVVGNNGLKHRVEQRIKPWIQRELQAILGDTDPSVIVQLATSLYIISFEEKLKVSSEGISEDKYVEQLRPFLQDMTNMFWHELRCFAECSFEITTYDSVVEYKQLE